jgi:hypothetical protein
MAKPWARLGYILAKADQNSMVLSTQDVEISAFLGCGAVAINPTRFYEPIFCASSH